MDRVRRRQGGPRRTLVAVFCCAFSLLSVAPASADEGGVDRTFGKAGVVSGPYGSFYDADAVLDADDRILVGGKASPSGFHVSRYLQDGSLDPSWGGDGEVETTSAPYPQGVAVQALAVDGEGRVVAGGSLQQGIWVLARYLPNGTLDSSFGEDGIVAQPVAEAGELNDLVIDAEDRIVGAGRLWDGSVYAFGTARFLPNGNLDSSYGEGDGIATVTVGESNDLPQAVVVDSAGRVVVAGVAFGENGTRRSALARFTSSGQPDSAFSGDGGLLGADPHSAFGAVALDGLGRIIAGGSVGDGPEEKLMVARYLDNGTPDAAFGVGGVSTRPVGVSVHVGSIALDSRGRIVAGATAVFPAEGSSVIAARYLADGTPDPKFGSEGVVTTPWGRGTDADSVFNQLISLMVDEQDRIPIVGLRDGSLRISRLIGDETTTIDSGPPDGSATRDTTPTFSFSSSAAGVTFECSFDGGDFQPCSSPQGLGPLSEGEHEFAVRALLPVEGPDPTPARSRFTIDTVPPQTSALTPVAEEQHVRFRFSSSEFGSTFLCRTSRSKWDPCSDPWFARRVSPPLGPGTHTFYVRATDRAGNSDPQPASVTFILDPVPKRCANRFFGTSRGDKIEGSSGGDWIFSKGGDDILNGLGGRDCLIAGAGEDRLNAFGGGDNLSGHAGNDLLRGGAGRDDISGGEGNDRLRARDGERDTVQCGRGRDIVTADRRDIVLRSCEKVRRLRPRRP